MLKEFREFIAKGNLVELAVALILALAFSQVIQALVIGVLNPLIAAVFGKPDLTSLSFNVGDASISIGFFLDALISFLITAFVLFLVVRAYNRMFVKEEEAAGPTEAELLTEIRDALRTR